MLSATRHPVVAFLLGTLGVVVAAVVVLPLDEDTAKVVAVLLMVVPVVVTAVLGGRVVALVVAVEAALALATAVFPPIGSPMVEVGTDLLTLAVFITVAMVVGTLIATVVASEERKVAAEVQRAEAFEALDEQRRGLLRAVSHDLRTPLGIIRAAASELEHTSPHDAAARHDLATLVGDEAERLDRLVANLLSLGRIEAGALQPARQPTDLAELVTSSASRLGRLGSRVHLVLDVAPDLPAVDVDPTQLGQVIVNLLENAIRHAPGGGTVRLVGEAAADVVTVSVTDDGPGIDPAIRDRLFEPFAAGPGSTTTGVGLAICKAVVEAHGGTIAVVDPPAGGACFVITLPISR